MNELYPIGFAEWLKNKSPQELAAVRKAEAEAIKALAHKPIHAMNEKELAKHVLSLPPDSAHFKQHSDWARSVK